ncbi:MAG: 50S ribosomal protein L15e [Candidatus Marsarchaeota archaeon]|nr:50S ribosomal protein L15e [Candidatus Marsarchaeota archaeon]
MSMYREVKQTLINEYKTRPQEYKDKLIKWNSEQPIVRVERPSNLTRARELGYRAKQGVVLARVRVLGGKKKRPMFAGGRKPSKAGRFFSRHKSMQAIAEERAGKKFSNCEVLNSYYVGESGSEKYYEVILLEKGNPSITSDRRYSQIVSQRRRAERGLTFAGRKHRGLSRRGYGTIMNRPSKRQNNRS